MSFALIEAEKAMKINEIPVGTVIVKDGKIVSKGYNKVQKTQNPLMHAEMIAIKKACKVLNTKYLTNCSLYTTLEPCYMCAGGISNAKISNLYIGAEDKRFGCILNGLQVYKNGNFNYIPVIYSEIMENECQDLLNIFFKTLRC